MQGEIGKHARGSSFTEVPRTAAYIKQWANARSKNENQKPRNLMRNRAATHYEMVPDLYGYSLINWCTSSGI